MFFQNAFIFRLAGTFPHHSDPGRGVRHTVGRYSRFCLLKGFLELKGSNLTA